MDYAAPLRFSSDSIPERRRMEFWRDAMAKPYLGVECEPMPDVAFYADTTARPLGDCALGSGAVHGAHMNRTKSLLGDGQDHFRWNILLSGEWRYSCRGREAMLAPGEGVLQSYADTGLYACVSSDLLGVRIPRAMLREVLPHPDDWTARAVPAQNATLSLLKSYWQAIDASDPSLSTGDQRVLAAHLCDLVAMTVRSAFGTPVEASQSGVRAAALLKLKQDVLRYLGRHDLSLEFVAARHRLSVRRIQRLFQDDGTTFSQFVQAQRLARVRETLDDPRSASRSIAEIAVENGFGDISTFNRFFRRRFGASPTDIRRRHGGR